MKTNSSTKSQTSQSRGFKLDTIFSIDELPTCFGRNLLIYFHVSWSQDKIQPKSIPKSENYLLKPFSEKMQTIDTRNSESAISFSGSKSSNTDLFKYGSGDLNFVNRYNFQVLSKLAETPNFEKVKVLLKKLRQTQWKNLC
ncbi:MAG: hypothetical protein HQM08_21040 [Candidatus Riflebacteria bacterium]|nr:hypothetical protein [Candidatus Riflebacteria bacterium]